MGSKKNGIRTESAAFDEKLGKTRYKTLPNLHYHRFLFEIDRLISIVRLMERKKNCFLKCFPAKKRISGPGPFSLMTSSELHHHRVPLFLCFFFWILFGFHVASIETQKNKTKKNSKKNRQSF